MLIPVILEVGIQPTEEPYSCYVPDILGCITTGKTFEETIHHMQEALELYFEGGTPMPKLRSLYEVSQEMREGDILASVSISIERAKAA